MNKKLPQVMDELLAQVDALIAQLPPGKRSAFEPPRCRHCGRVVDFSTQSFCSLECRERHRRRQRRQAQAIERKLQSRK